MAILSADGVTDFAPASLCVSQGDGEHMRKGAACLCTAYPSHGAVNYKQVRLKYAAQNISGLRNIQPN